MSIQITLTQSSTHTLPNPYTRHLLLDFQSLRPYYSLPQLHHVTATHPSPGDNPQECGRAVRKNAGPIKNVKLNHLLMHQGSPLLPIFRAQHNLYRNPSAAQGHLHAIHPTWHWSTMYPPPLNYTPHQHPSSHTVLIHSLHVPKPTQYSLIRSTLQSISIPALFRTFSFISQSIPETPTKFLKHFTARTFTFLLSALLITHASAP